MGIEAMEKITQQIKMNLQASKQKNQETLQKESEREQKKTSFEENSTHMSSMDDFQEQNAGLEFSVKSRYKCQECQDTGWILIPQEHRQSLAIACECRKIELLKNEWKASGINTEMSTHKFSNFEVWNKAAERAKETAISYYHDFSDVRGKRRNSIIFCGQVGSGKSHLSIALALNFLQKKIKVVYMPYRDVITKIKQNMLDADYYSKMISKYQICEVLLIDDLFKGKVNESDLNIIFEIINYRYLNYLPIIVSSEFHIERLLNFDEGVGSRIYEMSKDYVVEIEKDMHFNYRLK